MTETRNIIDHYHYWKHNAIIADLDKRRLPYGILCSNLYNDFNIACVIRSANAFRCGKVHVYGRKKYDKRGTVGMHHYEHVEFGKGPEYLDQLIGQYGSLVAIENKKEWPAIPLDDFIWPERPLLAFGQEQFGLPPEILKRADYIVKVHQEGVIRSLNVACAAAITMRDVYLTLRDKV